MVFAFIFSASEQITAEQTEEGEIGGAGNIVSFSDSQMDEIAANTRQERIQKEEKAHITDLERKLNQLETKMSEMQDNFGKKMDRLEVLLSSLAVQLNHS